MLKQNIYMYFFVLIYLYRVCLFDEKYNENLTNLRRKNTFLRLDLILGEYLI